MDRIILQVPVSPELRHRAGRAAKKQGFSTLQDAMRLILKKMADGKLEFRVEEAVRLSPRAIRRYNRILKDIEAGKNISRTKDVSDLMRQLHES